MWSGPAPCALNASRDNRSAAASAEPTRRKVTVAGQEYTVGVLVQANHGKRPWFNVLGQPVGRLMPFEGLVPKETGSIIVVIATDAPLSTISLTHLARRAGLGADGRVEGVGAGVVAEGAVAVDGATEPERKPPNLMRRKRCSGRGWSSLQPPAWPSVAGPTLHSSMAVAGSRETYCQWRSPVMTVRLGWRARSARILVPSTT